MRSACRAEVARNRRRSRLFSVKLFKDKACSSYTITDKRSEGMKKKHIDKTTVRTLDVHKYMGKWYEIARFDHPFERHLVGVTAEYSLMDNGKIRVINSGYKNNFKGRHKKIEGKAKIPDPKEPGKLKVSFFLWFYSDYYVLELDELHYNYALIGSKSDKFLWILSRTPSLNEKTLNYLLEKARTRGYDTSRLIWVPQQNS